MVQIQVNTANNVTGREELDDHVAATVEARLARFGDRRTRVEVHLADESAGRATGATNGERSRRDPPGASR